MKKIIKNIFLKIRGEVPTEKLVAMGLMVGENFNRRNGVIIDYSHCWLIRIGNNVTLAPRVHILAHDASTKMLFGYTKIGKVEIGNNTFIGADSLILPGVTIGDNVIVGAGSVVTKDVEDNVVIAGNPAKKICTIEEFKSKQIQLMNDENVFDKTWTISKDISLEMKYEMINVLENGVGFVE